MSNDSPAPSSDVSSAYNKNEGLCSEVIWTKRGLKMKLPSLKLIDKMRQQKLLSTTLLLFTLSIGIVIGTLINTGVHAQKSGTGAPDATPLVLPKATQIGNEFTKLAKMLDQSVV